jgi:hypothetical protein
MAPSRAVGLLSARALPVRRFVSTPTTQSRRWNTTSLIRATNISCTELHHLTPGIPSFALSVANQSRHLGGRSPRNAPCHHTIRRLYSANAAKAPDTITERPEAPDHLDEKEKAIFDKLNEALDPLALEVSFIPTPELLVQSGKRE